MKKAKKRPAYRTVPLSGSFMLTGLLGFIVTGIYTLYGKLDATWGFTLILVFLIMFIASVVSITPTAPSELKN